jgi:hypothetical protein
MNLGFLTVGTDCFRVKGCCSWWEDIPVRQQVCSVEDCYLDKCLANRHRKDGHTLNERSAISEIFWLKASLTREVGWRAFVTIP